MVLKKQLIPVVLVFFLAGCSLLTNTDQHGQYVVIPAYTDPDEDTEPEQDDEQVEVIQMNGKRTISSGSTIKKPSTLAHSEQVPDENNDQPRENIAVAPYPSIVQSLIERAEKAIAMQQWLRAQHILEQGLHIAPTNAKVFLIYGDVYMNLGILAKAEQMYLRSIALAGDGSVLGRLAKNKLEVLTAGN